MGLKIVESDSVVFVLNVDIYCLAAQYKLMCPTCLSTDTRVKLQSGCKSKWNRHILPCCRPDNMLHGMGGSVGQHARWHLQADWRPCLITLSLDSVQYGFHCQSQSIPGYTIAHPSILQ